MNSYPPEFLQHQLPLLFIAGLQAPPSSNQSVDDTNNKTGDGARSRAGSSATDGFRSRSGSLALSGQQAGRGRLSADSILRGYASGIDEVAGGAGSASAPVEEPVDPNTPQAGVSTSDGTATTTIESSAVENSTVDPFIKLQHSLYEKLRSVSGKGRVWKRKGEVYKIGLVDKGYRFPPRKTNNAPPHSPLSPLTPGSPVYPDGLLTPTWIRKHSEIVPSAFVLFLRLYEHTEGQASYTPQVAPASSDSLPPDASQTASQTGGTSAQAERIADEDRVREIADRSKKCAERAVKLTVVLMASRHSLEDPALDDRLSFIRRNSGLDSRASLFVLTPVDDSELDEFVTSLQKALLPASMEYYGNHYKRNRRKRSRLPVNPLAWPYATSLPQGTKGLLTLGWAVRYDYKAGVFAEMRNEIEGARNHFEDCWQALSQIFEIPGLLPPRTKRWAEAKVLADCIAVKVARLYLYEGNSTEALMVFHQHLARFGTLCKTWGIGEETFEFWSWVSRQYRLLAELTETALVHGLQLETSLPLYSSETSDIPHLISTQIPLAALQHPGYYYYTAANCSVQRWQRYKAALKHEEEHGTQAALPGLANEKQVDHAGIVIELYSKAYAFFKHGETSQQRMAVYIAYRIAEAYVQSEQWTMAIKFFERMMKSFKREQWGPIVWEIDNLWYDCAQRTGEVETAARLLFDLMSSANPTTLEDPLQYQEDLEALLQTTTPGSSDTLVFETEIFSAQCAFWDASRTIGEPALWHLELTSSPGARFETLSFSKVLIHFSGEAQPIEITHDAEVASRDVVKVEVGSSTNLNFRPGSQMTFQGFFSSSTEREVQVDRVELVKKEGSWTISLDIPVSTAPFPSTSLLWQDKPRVVFFSQAPHEIEILTEPINQVYLSEAGQHDIKLKNNQGSALDIAVRCAPLLPTTAVTIGIDEQSESAAEMPDQAVGTIEPGATLSTSITFSSQIEQTIPFDVQITTSLDGETQVHRKTVEVVFAPPFGVVHDVTYRLPAGAQTTTVAQAFVSTTVDVLATDDIKLVGMKYQHLDIKHCQQTFTSIDKDLDTLTVHQGDSFAILNRFDVTQSVLDDPSAEDAPHPAGHMIVEWQRSGKSTINTFISQIPQLRPPHTTQQLPNSETGGV